MKIEEKRVADLIPYERNAKEHDKTQIDNVAKSIEKYGFVQPLVIDKNNVVVIGHCRLLAAKKLKLKEVPCVCVDDLSEEEVNALRLVDNKTNESEWNDFTLPEIESVDLSEFDFDWGTEFISPEEIESEETMAETIQITINGLTPSEWNLISDEIKRIVSETNGHLSIKGE